MTTFPLMRAAGFYSPPIRLSIEEGIAAINIVNEDTRITGRFDILAVNSERLTTASTSFWVLVIETKEGLANVWAGLPLVSYRAIPLMLVLELKGNMRSHAEIIFFICLKKGADDHLLG